MSTSPETLIEAAKSVRDRAHAPYSRFAVGAAILTSTGEIFAGCNVENASYGLTICAERGAVMNWAAAGSPGEPSAVAIAARDGDGNWVAAMPCGACRQVLSELPASGELQVWIWNGQQGESVSLSELLPRAFGPEDLPRREG